MNTLAAPAFHAWLRAQDREEREELEFLRAELAVMFERRDRRLRNPWGRFLWWLLRKTT